jgi:hypothetical protein
MAGLNYGKKYTLGGFKDTGGTSKYPYLQSPRKVSVYNAHTMELIKTYDRVSDAQTELKVPNIHVHIKKNKYKELRECFVYKEKYIFIDPDHLIK